MTHSGARSIDIAPGTKTMNKFGQQFFIAVLAILALCGCNPSNPDSLAKEDGSSADFRLNSPPQKHHHMRRLVENAFAYLDPRHGMIDPQSGYPLEGWNQDPERGLFLRSFTQVTAIGEYIELLAIIASGQAENPYLSQEEAFTRIQKTVATLRTDQANPKLGARGLLVNFLGFSGGERIGPVATSVVRQDFIDQFGHKDADAIWQALIAKEWIKPQNQNTEGVVLRSDTFGPDFFDGPLERWADDTSIQRIMSILDERVVLVAYGDNANLSTSVAKAIGALLHNAVVDRPEAAELRADLEAFLDAQGEGYRGLIDSEAGMFRFGRDENTGRFFGWNNDSDEWIEGYQDYLVNEFRDPTMFLIIRYELPLELLGNLGFKMKSYETANGRTLFSLVPFTGAAFQVFGLDLAMPHLQHPTWRQLLKNAAAIGLNYATRHGHPGFLSESYSGNDTEYTDEVGMPEFAVTQKERITTAPSLYTLGTAYQIAPKAVNAFVGSNWPKIETLLTDHGPWEGWQTESKTPIEFQTTAHTLSLILGTLGQGPANMQRYLESNGFAVRLEALYRSGESVELLGSSVDITPWAADGAIIRATRTSGETLKVHSESRSLAGVLFQFSEHRPANLSGGLLELRYRSPRPVPHVVLIPKRQTPLTPRAIQSEIFTGFRSTTASGEITLMIPLPTTPGLQDISRIELNFEPSPDDAPTEFTLTAFRFSANSNCE